MFLRENEIGRKVAPYVRPGERVLDLGAGTGLISRWLARRVGVEPTLADLIHYGNRRREFPFLQMQDPFHVPAPDRSFDAVFLLFVLHHNGYEAQSKVLTEAVRLAANRVIVLEDTPRGRFEWACNALWDRILNLRHRVPTPCAFRTKDEWLAVFMEQGLVATQVESYRPKWPTLGTYHHTLFVVERESP